MSIFRKYLGGIGARERAYKLIQKRCGQTAFGPKDVGSRLLQAKYEHHLLTIKTFRTPEAVQALVSLCTCMRRLPYSLRNACRLSGIYM